MPGSKRKPQKLGFALTTKCRDAKKKKKHWRGVCLCTLALSQLFAYVIVTSRRQNIDFQISAVCIMYWDTKYKQNVVIKAKYVKLSLSTPWRHGVGRGIAPRILNLDNRWRWKINFTPRPLYSGNSRSGGLQNRSGCFGEEENFLPLLGFESRIVQLVARSLNRLCYPSSQNVIHFHYEIIIKKKQQVFEMVWQSCQF